MAGDKLEEILAPAAAVELGAPCRQCFSLNPGKQGGPLKGPIDEGGDTPVGGKGQQTLFDGAILKIVGELDEIERFPLHDIPKFLVVAAVGGGYTDITESALLLPLPQDRQ